MATIIDQGFKCTRDEGISFIRGDTAVISIPVKDESDSNVDASSGFRFDFQAFDGSSSVLVFTEADDEVTLGNGVITIELSADNTRERKTSASLVYAARLYDDSNDIIVTIQNGILAIIDSPLPERKDVAVTGVVNLIPEITIAVGDKVKLAVDITPANASDKRVAWTSETDGEVTVSATGVIEGIAVTASCEITATSVGDPTKSAVCTVTVEEAGP